MSGHAAEIPAGVTVVVKNDYFTYVKGTGSEHRHAVQVWNVTSVNWTFHIYTGGTYTFGAPAKKETNVFHKKHLLTLSGGKTLDGKSLSIYTKRTTSIEDTNTARNKTAGEFVTAMKPNMAGTPKQQTNAARAKQPEIYLQKGYGNKLTAATLTVIDCATFLNGNAIGECFASALHQGATGAQAALFITGATWHPTVDFGRACVYECPNGVLDPAAKTKAKVHAHLLSVDGAARVVVCHVYHLESAFA